MKNGFLMLDNWQVFAKKKKVAQLEWLIFIVTICVYIKIRNFEKYRVKKTNKKIGHENKISTGNANCL